MPLHELRIFRLSPGVPMERCLEFFHSGHGGDLREALRAAGIPFVAAWTTGGRADELVWIRAFESAAHKERACAALYGGPHWNGGLSARAAELIEEVETYDLSPFDVSELRRGPRARGFHELRHYRIAPGTMPKYLSFFEDVRRLNAELGVRVLAWWRGEHEGTERFLWLREFSDAATKARIVDAMYNGERWLRDFKPRVAGVVEERILRDLEPVPESRIGPHDAFD